MSTDTSKIKVTEKEFQTKLVDCTGSAITSAVLTSITAAFTIPIVLWRLKFLRTNIETRLALGVVSAVPVGYFMALKTRTDCMERVENNYTY